MRSFSEDLVWYDLALNANGLLTKCNCEDFQKSAIVCKHMWLATRMYGCDIFYGPNTSEPSVSAQDTTDSTAPTSPTPDVTRQPIPDPLHQSTGEHGWFDNSASEINSVHDAGQSSEAVKTVQDIIDNFSAAVDELKRRLAQGAIPSHTHRDLIDPKCHSNAAKTIARHCGESMHSVQRH